MTSAERRSRLDPQVHRVHRPTPAVVGAIDEEASRPHRRQAGQRHRQPVGVREHLHADHKAFVRSQRLPHALGLVRVRGEDVDAPDVMILVLLQDGVGRALQ